MGRLRSETRRRAVVRTGAAFSPLTGVAVPALPASVLSGLGAGTAERVAEVVRKSSSAPGKLTRRLILILLGR